MHKPLITKAEVLITRRCNIQCGTCRVIEPALDLFGKPTMGAHAEMSVERWCRAYDVIFDCMGASFSAIYGGEPLVFGDDKLCEIFKHLAKKRNGQRDFSIISNGIGLNRTRAQRFLRAGLESWTSSVDCYTEEELGDKHMNGKTRAGLRALELTKQLGYRDTMAIVTITARNLDYVIPTVEFLCKQGHWVGIDVLHYQRGDGQYTFSSTREQMFKMGVLLGPGHMDKLSSIADTLMERHSDLLVFPTMRVLEMMKEQRYAVDLTWKCTPAHAITVDYNGLIGLCDDRMPTGYSDERRKLAVRMNPARRAWHILDFELEGKKLLKQWDRFLRWYAADLKHCDGCFWMTHVLTVDALRDSKLREHYIHHRTPGQLTER